MKKLVWKIFLVLVVSSSILLFIGCMGSPSASKEEEESAKKFLTDPDNSVIYIYRDTIVAMMQTFRLYIDDSSLIGEAKNKSFFRIIVQPGTHTITVTNMRNVALENMSISTDAGKVYYVELQLGANPISGIPKLKVVEEKESQKKIQGCSLLKTGTTAMDK